MNNFPDSIGSVNFNGNGAMKNPQQNDRLYKIEFELDVIKKTMATKSELDVIKNTMATKSELEVIKKTMATKTELSDMKISLIKWMIGLTMSTIAINIGTIIGLASLLK